MSNTERECGIRGVLQTEDGHEIVWRRFEPEELGDAEGVVVIAAAMGVTQSFYRAFAHWLSTQNFVAVTFDYLGMGESLSGPLSAVPGDVIRWAAQDASAVLGEVLRRYPDLPVTWVGHSQAGHTVPFIQQHERFSKLIFVTAGSGYWKKTAPNIRRFGPLLWRVVVPLSLRLFGYFPGARLGVVGNLPHGVMSQWRAWCLHPDYLIGVQGAAVRPLYDAVTTPTFVLSTADDELMSYDGIAALNAFYPNSPQDWLHLEPQSYGLDVVGHMGVFRRSNQVLWPQVLLPALARRAPNGVSA